MTREKSVGYIHLMGPRSLVTTTIWMIDAIHVITPRPNLKKKGCGEVIVRRLVSHFSQSNSTIKKKRRRCDVKSDSTESLGKYRFLLNWFISARHIQNAVTNLRSNEKKTHWRAQGYSSREFKNKKRNSYEVDIEQISTVLAFRWYEIKKGPPGATTKKENWWKGRGRPFHHHTRSPFIRPWLFSLWIRPIPMKRKRPKYKKREWGGKRQAR